MRSGSMLRPEQGSGEWARPCESCAAAPSSVYCRADGAYLCAGCDADIHSANPLARRHQRDAIFPLHHNHGRHLVGDIDKVEAADEEEAASWLVTANPNNGFLFGGEEEEEEEEFHDVAEENGERSEGTEQMVPMECMVSNQHLNLNLNHHQHQQHHHHQQQLQEQQYFPMGLESEVSGVGFGYSATLTHSVSFSSMDSGEVPENSTMVDNNSNFHCRVSKGTIDLFSGHPAPQAAPPPQFTPMDREARVLRYREKKMKRKFEKTIRYASRKAYAETRPRIKGRFAKRSDVELEVDQMFSTSEGSYGLVPSF